MQPMLLPTPTAPNDRIAQRGLPVAVDVDEVRHDRMAGDVFNLM